MVTITVQDSKTEQTMTVEITQTQEDSAHIKVKFDPPLDQDRPHDLWSSVAYNVVNGLKDEEE